MRPLREWSFERVLAAWGIWLALLVGVPLLGAYATASLWRPPPPARASGTVVLPPQSSDFIFAVVGDELGYLALPVFGPPLALTAVWWLLRRPRRPRPEGGA